MAFLVPEVIATAIFGAVVTDEQRNDRFDVKAIFVPAFRATDAFEAIAVAHAAPPFALAIAASS